MDPELIKMSNRLAICKKAGVSGPFLDGNDGYQTKIRHLFQQVIYGQGQLSEKPKAFWNISDKGIKGNNKYSLERRRDGSKDCVWP